MKRGRGGPRDAGRAGGGRAGAPDLAGPQTPAGHRDRWERIGLGIRLACTPQQPGVMQAWISLGSRLAAQRVLDEEIMLRKTVKLLLQAAHDEALPWPWRRACVQAAPRPVARLAGLLRPHDPAQAEAMHAFLHVARRHVDRAARPAPAPRPLGPGRRD